MNKKTNKFDEKFILLKMLKYIYRNGVQNKTNINTI